MKKLFLIIIFLMIINIYNHNLVKAENNTNFKEEVYQTSLINPKTLIPVNENIIVYQTNKSCFISEEENIFIDDGILKAATLFNNNILIILENEQSSTIYKYDLNNKTITKETFNKTIINKILIHNQNIYLAGSLNNNACIYILDDKLKTTKTITYPGDGFEEITNIIFNENYFYITIYKDALSNNSFFISSGNLNEYKSIVVKLEQDLSINNTFYINENTENEQITSFIISNNNIQLLLKTTKEYIFYQLNLDLKINDYQKLSKNYHEYFLLNNYHSNYDYLILANYYDEITLLGKQNNNLNIEPLYFLKNNGYILNYNIYFGELYIYLFNESNFEIIKLNHYELSKNDLIIINKFNNINNLENINFNNYIKPESFFEELIITKPETSPYFQNNLPGLYELSIQIERLNKEIIDITSQILVKSYTNFIDQGIYSVNKKLEFLGHAECNNELIYNGHQLTDPGKYEIIITNANNIETKYTIYIVEEDSIDEEITNIPCEYETTDDEYTVTINLDSKVDISEIIINDTQFNNYQIVDNKLLLKFELNNGANSFNINQINYYLDEELRTLEINKLIDIYKTRSPGELLINKTITKENLKIDLDIIDKANTFKYFKLLSKEEEQIITTSTKLKITGNNKLYYVYSDDKNYYQTLVTEYDVTETVNLNLDLSFDNQTLLNTVITIDNPTTFTSINKINVGGLDISGYYLNYQKHNFLPTIIYISLGVLGIFLVLILVKIIIKTKKSNQF